MRDINDTLADLHEGWQCTEYKLDDGTISVSELNVLRQF